MLVEYVNDNNIILRHERISYTMEVWNSGNQYRYWYWNMTGGPVMGHDPNMMVAIEKAMAALEKIALGE